MSTQNIINEIEYGKNALPLNTALNEFLSAGRCSEYLIDFAAAQHADYRVTISTIANAFLHRAVRSGDIRPLNAFFKRFMHVRGFRFDLSTIFRVYLAGIPNIRTILSFKLGEYAIAPGTSTLRVNFELPPLTSDIFTTQARKKQIDKTKTEPKLAREAANHLRNALKCCEALNIKDTAGMELLREKMLQIANNSPED